MTGDCHVGFYQRRVVRFLPATHQVAGLLDTTYTCNQMSCDLCRLLLYTDSPEHIPHTVTATCVHQLRHPSRCLVHETGS